MILNKSVICPVVIGRENDLQVLDRLIQQAGDKSGQIALISGEAGIGKSRLVKEVKARALNNTVIVEGHCFQTETALPYAPLLDLFRNFLGSRSDDEIASIIGDFAPHLARLLPELTVHLPYLTSAPNPDPKQEKRRVFQALAQTMTGFAQSQPLIVIIEDLHWSDSTSLEFLLQLARRVPTQPILLVITYRSDETTPELTHFLAELDRERLGTEFILKRLSPLEVDAMVQTVLDLPTPVSKEFLDAIFSLTEGNPFFIEEILKALIAEGDIFYVNGTWDRKEVNQLRIPRTIKDAVQRRTQQLDKQTLQALTLASVMGRRFDFHLLQGMLEVNEEELMSMLKSMVEAQLVVEETADQFAFRHALTREAIYSTLLLRERQMLHRLAGEAIEKIHAASLQSHTADLSYHYYTGNVWQKALDYSRQAGDQARTLYAQREAIVHYSRALVAGRQLNMVMEPELLRSRGHAYEILGDFKSALDDFEQGLKIARQKGDGHAEWQTLIDIGFLWAGRDYQQTGKYFRRAEELARNLNETKLHAHSLNRLGNWSVNVGQTLQGLKSHRRALEIFEQNEDEQGMADTHDLLGMATLQHGDPISSYDEHRHAIQLFRKLGDKHGLISALTVCASTPYWDETNVIPDQSQAENQHMALEALELTQQIGWAAGQSFIEWSYALGLGIKGNFGEALAHATEALRFATEIEHRQWIAGAQYVLGHIHLLMLQADHAIQYLEEGLSLAQELGSAWWIGNITTDLVLVYLLKNDREQARLRLDSVFRKTGGHHNLIERRLLWAKGNLLLVEHEPEEALRVARRLLDSKADPHVIQLVPALFKLKGEALMAMGQWQKAGQALEQAKQGAMQRGLLPILWQIHCLLGRLCQEQKDPEKAGEEFANAHQIVRALEATIQDENLKTGFTHAALEFLPKEKAISNHQGDGKKFGGLTPREREVTRFLSQGKSNREIAEVLVLSERTVENHVGNILAKLGFESRAQVAVWAVEMGLGKKN